MKTRENRGKRFEEVIKECFKRVPGVSVDRIHDQTTGYAGSSNISDFIVYYKPHQIYIECKSCYGNTLSFANITPHQWKGLLEKSKIDGVVAGVLIWFMDHNYTTFIPIQALESHAKFGEKSINIKQLRGSKSMGKLLPYGMNDIEIHGDKKRVFFDYDMKSFLEYLKWLESEESNEF